MSDNEGGPAFPSSHSSGELPVAPQRGMSLRDYFAAQALTGVITSCSLDHRHEGEDMKAMFARRAYELADAMLEARKR